MTLLPILFALGAVTQTLTSPAYLCVPALQLRQPELCAPAGPGAYAAQWAAARVPYPEPVLPAEPLPLPAEVTDFTYAHVTATGAPLFASPEDGAANVVTDTLGAGFVFVTLSAPAQVGDQLFYKTRRGLYIRASDVSLVEPSKFRGLTFYANPIYPLAWVLKIIRPSPAPGRAPPKQGPRFAARTPVYIYATVMVNGWDWYLVGPGQWLEQRSVAKVDLHPPPEGITGKWIQVNLYEQTLSAYEDGQIVFATLVASGLSKWPTQPGLFKIWARLKTDLMTGSYEANGSDYYYLEAVPWVMYFDGQRALHGEYWHDRLGYPRSHGCVNLAPTDARWLFDWTEIGLPVWVYDPTGQTPLEGNAGGAP